MRKKSNFLWAMLIAICPIPFSACSSVDNPVAIIDPDPTPTPEPEEEITEITAPAFPGAEGHGRYVTGGRGGEVRHVTNLNDKGEGSLRAAVNGNNKKIVVFDISGIIALESDLVIGANTTIEGQTAPAPGITVRYQTVRPSDNNIIRFLRIRRGEEKDVNDGADAIWQRQKDGIVLDHCSFSWSIDEIASFYDNQHFTMQWCTLGDGARYNYDKYDTEKYANSVQAEIVDFRNCVMYNWGAGNGCYGGTGGGNINIVNNYYKAGPATKNKTRVTQISVATSSNASGSDFMGYCSRYYINGNYVTAAGNKAENYDWQGVIYDAGTSIIDGEHYIPDTKHMYGESIKYRKNSKDEDCVIIKLDNEVETGKVTTHSAQNAYQQVLTYAGASLYRDDVDARYMKEAADGTTTYTGSAEKTGDGKAIAHRPGIIDFVKDQGEYTLESNGRPDNFDTDSDGMPDAWETANGLDPLSNDAAEYTLDKHGFYTNVEVYCNSLVEEIMKAENDNADSRVDEYYPRIK